MDHDDSSKKVMLETFLNSNDIIYPESIAERAWGSVVVKALCY
jgi:hypothetical protein